MRAFFAVGGTTLSENEALCAEARAVVSTLRERCQRVRHRSERTVEARWLREESWHVTLRFLGDIAVAQVGELAHQARAALANVASFELRLSRAMTFPPKRPRTLVLDLEPHEPLTALAAAVDQSVVACGFRPEGRAFTPHLTVARTRSGSGHFRESDTEGVAATGAAQLHVSEVVLFRSELRPAGAHYTPLECIALQERVANGGQVHP